MRLLVTGAAGFIGSAFTRALLDGTLPDGRDVRVTALDLLTYAGDRNNLPADHPRMEFVQADIRDYRTLRELLPGHDAVINFAAETHVDRSIDGSAVFLSTNVVGTQVLLDAVLESGVERFVQVSTDEVYGSIDKGSWTEDAPLLPNSPYSASKAAGDLLARAYWRTHGLDLSITRCCNNYGPRQHPEKLIPRFVTNLLEGEQVPLYGDGLNVREWLHVDDHCRALNLVLRHGRAGEVYNIGGGDERTNLALTNRLLELCGADRSAVRPVADRPGHDRRYSLDDSKIRDELGHAPLVEFERGLADVVGWYRDNPDWWKPIRDGARVAG
ncbi:dTDP-glucose 4,6-dehydratase [Actinomadura pelletieri DSM 43383]|uniref:dTDP-glucose 4,6-dehydratase n=1 Tax=Actinomadura pelletieri DSM 43383 TaxID=1120940 RepID=A0A495Q9Q2_9ACTN|nr:dTDP-glucose 4,6-dehydratase [Actinomadura pelletieri]RKS68220.1 dTDP-glucose 4,6-dehydratase [Actinomadura pelletieri DSM 43383]